MTDNPWTAEPGGLWHEHQALTRDDDDMGLRPHDDVQDDGDYDSDDRYED